MTLSATDIIKDFFPLKTAYCLALTVLYAGGK